MSALWMVVPDSTWLWKVLNTVDSQILHTFVPRLKEISEYDVKVTTIKSENFNFGGMWI